MELKIPLPTTEDRPPEGRARETAGTAPRAGVRSDEDARAAERGLIAACRAGDRVAMRRLYETWCRRVFSLTARIAGAQEAEELTQEVFLKIYRGLDKFRGDAQLGTWIYRMAVNAALSHVSRSKDKRHAPEEAMAELAAPAHPSIDGGGDPRVRARLGRALGLLPPGYRAVLVLHDVEGLEHEEIAEVLGCRVGTSKSQLHKARAKMRELLGPELAAERGGGQP